MSTRLVYVIPLMLQHVSTAKCNFQGRANIYIKGNVFSFNCVWNWDLKFTNLLICVVYCT